MSNLVSILIWPLAACLSMGLLHGYAGLHVLRRGVIFVDLALAQMAALGAVFGMVMAHQGGLGSGVRGQEKDLGSLLTPDPRPLAPGSQPGDELDQAVKQTG